MPPPGHRRMTNFGPQANRARQRDEVAVVESSPRAVRTTIPYYRQPMRRRDVITEAAIVGENNFAEPAWPLADVSDASFGETSLLEVVIGNDDRVRVEQPFMRSNPWRQICALRVKSTTGKLYVGTAWFIGPKTLATAGHCVFLQREGGWAASIDVIPAKFGPSEPFGRISSQRFGSVRGWVEENKRDFDYGVIFLDDSTTGGRLGNFEVESLRDDELRGTEAKISGYPADRERAEFQYYHERPLTSTTESRLNYDIDTFGGQSGSPIWHDTERSGLVAIGIHTTGGATGNSGTRISDPVIDNLIEWLQE